MTIDEMIQSALNLPQEERARLAREIIASLEGPPDEGVEAAWVNEIERRVRDIRDGQVQLVDWPEVRQRIEARLAPRK